MAFLPFDKVQVLLYDGEKRFFIGGLYGGDVNDAREENRRMKARLKIAYSDEAWSMIGEIEGLKSVCLKDSHIKGEKHYVPHKIMNNAFMVISCAPGSAWLSCRR